MIHNLRRKDGTVYPLDVELGTTFADKNGREIFEGDTVKLFLDGCPITDKVEFKHGEFWINDLPLSDVIFECDVLVVD